jgi:hypothetical protein
VAAWDVGLTIAESDPVEKIATATSALTLVKAAVCTVGWAATAVAEPVPASGRISSDERD